MPKLSPKARKIFDRIAYWNSPATEDIPKLQSLRVQCAELLEAILEKCPDNRERDRAVDAWELMLDSVEKSIKRHGQDRENV
jgi:hypothetical protein